MMGLSYRVIGCLLLFSLACFLLEIKSVQGPVSGWGRSRQTKANEDKSVDSLGTSRLSTSTPQPQGKVTVVAESVRFGLCNKLGYMITAKILQLQARQHNLDASLVALESKVNSTHLDIQKCFPNAVKSFIRDPDEVQALKNTMEEQRIQFGESLLKLQGKRHEFIPQYEPLQWDRIQSIARNQTNDKDDIVIVSSSTMSFFQAFLDGAYPQVAEYMHMDPACCSPDKPADNETVLHIRFFEDGYPDTTPDQLVNRILQNFTVADPIVIVTPKPSLLRPIQQAMDARQLTYRIQKPGNKYEDLCFLMQANNLVGYEASTYAAFAAVFGKAKNTILYRMRRKQKVTRSVTYMLPEVWKYGDRHFRFPWVAPEAEDEDS